MSETENEPEVVEEQEVKEPEAESPAKTHNQPANRFERLKTWYLDRKKWTIPLSVLLVLLILAGVPFTRYNSVGLVHKRNLDVQVVDATAGTPVSGATVRLGSINAETSGTGVATLSNVKVGNQTLMISKKYYKSTTYKVLAPIGHQKTVPSIKLTATGRQVKISVANLITKKQLSGVDIKVADISAKTDEKGNATIVLPAGVSQQSAILSLDNYNDAKGMLKVSNDKIQENDFNLTPAGKVYFLSKLSGKIDVVKTNLDGTNRQTVLAGTGKEDDTNTVLLASRDWKYLALLSKRAGGLPALYLIDTSDDSLTTIDQGNADFSVTGWAGDNFIYTVTHNDVQLWQPARQVLKSYDATDQQITKLDQTNANGTNSSDYVYENYSEINIVGTRVFYSKTWSSDYYNLAVLVGKKAGIYSVDASGKSPATLKSIDQSGAQMYIDSISYRPFEIYFKITQTGTDDHYLQYANGKLTDNNNLADTFNVYYQDPVTYLQSPSGNNTFWSEDRDGKKTLFIGDSDGQGQKQIATLSDYSSYGWFTDSYLLVSKNASELYIMAKDGSQAAVKISDYHKPAYTFYGYGGGYGGI